MILALKSRCMLDIIKAYIWRNQNSENQTACSKQCSVQKHSRIPPLKPTLPFQKKLLKQSRLIFSVMAGITIILLHFSAVRQSIVQQWDITFIWKKGSEEDSAGCCSLSASIVSWELIQMRRSQPQQRNPRCRPQHTHTLKCYRILLYWFNNVRLRAWWKHFSHC